MSKRVDLIVKYAGDIEKRCDVKAGIKLLTAFEPLVAARKSIAPMRVLSQPVIQTN